jgi:hypothetical protein
VRRDRPEESAVDRKEDNMHRLLLDTWIPVLSGGLLLLTSNVKSWAAGFIIALGGILLQFIVVVLTLRRLRRRRRFPAAVAAAAEGEEPPRQHFAWRIAGTVLGMGIVGLTGFRVGMSLGWLILPGLGSALAGLLGGLGLGLLGAGTGALAGYLTIHR